MQQREYVSYPAAPIRRHPIFRTAGLDFIPHHAIHRPLLHCECPGVDTLILLKARADWAAVSREDGLASLSSSEIGRARHYPNPSIAKRYLVGRAVLRCALSNMLNCSPAVVDLVESAQGQPQLRGAAFPLSICVAYVGTSIVIAMSAAPLALGVAAPAAGADRDAAGLYAETDVACAIALFPDLPGCPEWTQQRARRRSVSRLAAGDIGSLDLTIATQYGAAFMIDTPQGPWGQVLDLPMPGRVAGAVALARRVTRIDAFGWMRD